MRCSRDEFMKALQAENVDCGVHYPTPLNKQPIIEELLKPKACPVSEKLSKTILSLPMHPYLDEQDLDKVVEAVEKVAAFYQR